MQNGRNRGVLLLTVVALQSACGPLIVTEVSEANPVECQDVTDTWTVDLECHAGHSVP